MQTWQQRWRCLKTSTRSACYWCGESSSTSVGGLAVVCFLSVLVSVRIAGGDTFTLISTDSTTGAIEPSGRTRTFPANGALVCTWLQPMTWQESTANPGWYEPVPNGTPYTGDEARSRGPIMIYSVPSDTTRTGLSLYPSTVGQQGYPAVLKLDENDRLYLDMENLHPWSIEYVVDPGRNDHGYHRTLGALAQTWTTPELGYDSLVGSSTIRVFTHPGGGYRDNTNQADPEPYLRFTNGGWNRKLWMKLEIIEWTPGTSNSSGGEGAWTEGQVDTLLNLTTDIERWTQDSASALEDIYTQMQNWDAITFAGWSALFASMDTHLENIEDDTGNIMNLLNVQQGFFGEGNLPDLNNQTTPEPDEDLIDDTAGTWFSELAWSHPDFPDGGPGPSTPPVIDFTVPVSSITSWAGIELADFEVSMDFAFFAPYRTTVHAIFLLGLGIWGVGRVWQEFRKF